MPRYVIQLEVANQKTLDELRAAVRARPEVSKAVAVKTDPTPAPAKETMGTRIITVDASGWTRSRDIYDAILPLLGAPVWHGDNMNALTESIVWGEINAVEPPYVLRIHGTATLPPDVAEELGWLKEGVTDGRAEFNVRRGHDVDVDVELLP